MSIAVPLFVISGLFLAIAIGLFMGHLEKKRDGKLAWKWRFSKFNMTTERWELHQSENNWEPFTSTVKMPKSRYGAHNPRQLMIQLVDEYQPGVEPIEQWVVVGQGWDCMAGNFWTVYSEVFNDLADAEKWLDEELARKTRVLEVHFAIGKTGYVVCERLDIGQLEIISSKFATHEEAEVWLIEELVGLNVSNVLREGGMED